MEGMSVTKKEKETCEMLMNAAIQVANDSNNEFALYEQIISSGETINAEINKRKADQHYGEAVGMNRVLVSLKYEHPNMKILESLL